ncbi:MAG: Ig domain-containing protein, partial [Candidatus Coproplasma sp.]
MKRASKRLVMSIIALVASVILCIGMCLAWFAMNKDVSGNGMQTQVKGSDIVSFEVVASYLDFNDSNKTDYKTTDNGNVSTLEKTFDKDDNGVLDLSSDNGSSSNDEMRSFDSTKMYSSAVLFTVDYEILAGSDKTFRIYATCPYTTEHMTENVFTVIKSTAEGETDTYYSSVSNAVFLTEASLSGGKYTCKTSGSEAIDVKFIKEDYSKYFTRYLKTGIESTSSDANTKGTLYYLMDYDEDLFNVLTNAMLTSGGTLNSKIVLDGDVVFGIEEYDISAAEPTVETVTFVNSTSVTTQAAGSDVMTASWQFLLDYSDDTLETVKYNSSDSSDFVITGLDTSVVGENKTVTITYKGITVQYQPAEGEATTEIPYTISKATTVTGITLNKYTLSLIYNSDTPATAQLTATISPSDATNQTVLWTSSNTSVATVSSTGLVTATGAGTATITAKSDANNEITNSCTVTVTASSSATAVTGVTLDSKTLALYVNSSVANADKATLTATITPEGATN